jgi:hypothetical protein
MYLWGYICIYKYACVWHSLHMHVYVVCMYSYNTTHIYIHKYNTTHINIIPNIIQYHANEYNTTHKYNTTHTSTYTTWCSLQGHSFLILPRHRLLWIELKKSWRRWAVVAAFWTLNVSFNSVELKLALSCHYCRLAKRLESESALRLSLQPDRCFWVLLVIVAALFRPGTRVHWRSCRTKWLLRWGDFS